MKETYCFSRICEGLEGICFLNSLQSVFRKKRSRRKNYISNPYIDTERSVQNRIFIAPKQSLYKDCKEQIEKRVVASGGRITKASNWICEAVFSYPEELPLERLDEYNDLIIKYMNARFNNNVVSAVCHLDIL